jgi:hypothetical protein
MLKNPDVAPSANMNRWILSILMFHFTLEHVPGTHHGPYGLQPGDEEEDSEADEEFEDWIDKVNRFMHMINEPANFQHQQHNILVSPPISCYITESTRDHTLPPEDIVDDLAALYSDVPRSDNAISADLRIRHVRQWLRTLKRPQNLTDSDYKMFI